MQPAIPQGLRNTFLAQFVYTLIFGLAGTFAASFVGSLAGHPVHDGDVNMGLGIMTLAFALGSWYSYKATRWEQISLFSALSAFIGVVGGILNVFAYFVPGFVNEPSLPPVQLLIAAISLAFGVAFSYYYYSVSRAMSAVQARQ